MTDDGEQLSRFVKGDEGAFSDLVGRHFDLVYSTALRQLNGDRHLAEDVAQTVFTDLARKAHLLPRRVVLSGWLYQATRFAAAKVVRAEQRRRAREQEALAMQDVNTETLARWEEVGPVVDMAMGRLSARDRDAVLLHYFEGRDFGSVGAILGVSADAAQKRVSRALGKLRGLLTRRGVTASAAGLAALLSTQSVQSAPPGLALSVAKSSLAGAAAAGPVVAAFLSSLKAQLLAAAIAVLLLGGGGAAYWVHGAHAPNQKQFRSVDLSAYYNGTLQANWTPAYGPDNNLAALGTGWRVLAGVPFEVGGVLQLQGEVFKARGYALPERVAGIPVGRRAREVHLLHANSGFRDPAGTQEASLVLHYADGTQAELPLRQQLDFLDWWEWPRASIKTPSSPNSVVAWRGRNPAADHEGTTLRLFATTLTNPQPEKEIQTLDYVSAMTNGAPFLVALTLER